MPLRWLSVLVTVGLAPTLLWRRTHPFTVVAIAFGVAIVVDVVLLVADAPALDSYTMIYFLLLPYSLFRWGSGREAAYGLAIILVAATLGIFVSWTGLADAIGGSAVLMSAFALGLSVRTQHGARDRRLEQVKSEERVQLARELHDTVAHHVSAIAIQAQAGRALAATSPGLVPRGVGDHRGGGVAHPGRDADHGARAAQPGARRLHPQPGVGDLERLVSAPATGPRVELSVAGDLTGLPAAVDAAVFRIAQEGVTNALRHARNASRVDVRVEGDGASVQVHVVDDGDPSPAQLVPGSGFGLTGMVERATLLGGTCRVGPCPGRGWAIEASLPRVVPG